MTTKILLLLAVIFQFNGIMSQSLSVAPKQKQFCDYDAFSSSQPYNGKVFLHPWKKVERQADWWEARGYCAAHCAELVTINSAEENAFFLDFMRNVGITQGVWIGAEVTNKVEFDNWSNGSPAPYHNKAVGEYDQDGYSCINAAYIVSQNFWYNYLCDYTGYFVACQRPADWTPCE